MASSGKHSQRSRRTDTSKGERLSRAIVAVVTCLGALGFFALIYFPLKYLK